MAANAGKLEKLEAVRGLAGFYVFVHHYVHCNNELAFFQKFFIFGQTAVMVFFILSGFVIYYSAIGRKDNLNVRDYLVRRLRRIYPAYILVLLMGYALPKLVNGDYVTFKPWDFIGNLLMLQDKQHPHIWFEPYQGNTPLWSLSYEWWFYLLFIPVWFAFRKWPLRQQYLAAGITLTGFLTYWLVPNQFSIFAAYFMLWWSGVELAREYVDTGKVTWRRQAFSISMLALNSLLWIFMAYLSYRESGRFVRLEFPNVQVQHQVTVLCMVVGAILWYKLRWIGFKWTIGPFKLLSPISYVIYILHLPIVLWADYINLTGSVWLDILWVWPLIFGISWVIEVPVQRWINRVVK